jgi:hypothetical protein
VSTAADRTAGLRPQPQGVTAAARQYLHTEAGGAVLLLLATIVALIWANSPWSGSYERFWETPLSLQLGDAVLSESLRHWVNDLLMALFFLLVGLEIARELSIGEYRDRRAVTAPGAAAGIGCGPARGRRRSPAVRPAEPCAVRAAGDRAVVGHLRLGSAPDRRRSRPRPAVRRLSAPRGRAGAHPGAGAAVPDRPLPRAGARGRPHADRIPVGERAGTWLALRLPTTTFIGGVRWGQLSGIGAVAGIGFTIALFITDLAFDDAALQQQAKIGILAGSALAALLSLGIFRFLSARGALCLPQDAALALPALQDIPDPA